MAWRGVLISGGILLFFAFVGEYLLNGLGISLAALKVSGGILLLLIGIEMVFGQPAERKTQDESQASEAAEKDISVFPLATPIIAGPGTMGAVILLMADTGGDVAAQTAVVLALIAILFVTLLFLLLTSRVQHWVGATGLHVVGRVFGVLLSALAVQFLFDGLLDSGLFSVS